MHLEVSRPKVEMLEERLEQEELLVEVVQEQMMEQRSWRFAYEALTRVHSLRLFLFNPTLSLPSRFSCLRAYLLPTSPFSASPVVVCQWLTSDRNSHTVYVPMPFCLIDHSAPFVATRQTDYIEVKLKLLPFGGSFLDGLSFLGFSHRGIPIKRNGVRTQAQKRDEAPFTLSSDSPLLASTPELCFYCRSCSAQLNKTPLSGVLELPSMEWRDLADHWFGTCCCSDGVKTQTLLARFQQLLTPAKGVCLVGSTTCITHLDDIIYSGDTCRLPTSSPSFESHPDEKDDVLKNVGAYPTLNTASGSLDTPSLKAEDGIRVKTDSNSESELPLGDDQMDENESCGSHCGMKHGEAVCGDKPMATISAAKPKVLRNGFMSGPGTAHSTSKWLRYNCHSCSELLGVYSDCDEGVQLFKCHISTDRNPDKDIFRHHTLERVFSNELLENTEGNSSYRYIVRGANNNLPLLQLVLLNHESWNCYGSCLGEVTKSEQVQGVSMRHDTLSMFLDDEDENRLECSPDCELLVGIGKEEFPPAFLEPVMKVMFCDLGGFSSEQLRGVEEWALKQQADDIYMFESEIEALTEILNANQRLFPESCAAFQQFRFSFLTR